MSVVVRKLIRCLYLSAVLIAVISTNTLVILGQATNENSSVIVIRESENDSTEVIRVDSNGNTTVLFTISSNDCYVIGDSLERIAISQSNSPNSVQVFSLETGQLISSVIWQTEWSLPCSFRFINEDNIFIATNVNGNVWQGASIDLQSGNSQVIDLLSNSLVNLLPNLTPAGALYTLSPTEDLVVYIRCDTSEIEYSNYSRTGEACFAPSRPILYDLNQQTTIQILQDTPVPEVDDNPNTPIWFFTSFAWSPSGRFLSYPHANGDSVRVFDTLLYEYISTSSIQAAEYTIMQTFGDGSLQWSPDETKFGFWLKDQDNGWNFAFYDMVNQSFTVLPILAEDPQQSSNAWGWMPDSQSITVILEDNNLYEIDLIGNQNLIISGVGQVRTFSPP